ncbi:hypothetical protein TSOC_007205, partial [Tetrabaena socialis]
LLMLISPAAAAVGDLPLLHYAALEGSLAAATVLLNPRGRWWLAHDLQPEVLVEQVAIGVTPLHRAVTGGHAGMVQLLLAAGAQPLAAVAVPEENGFKDTPVHRAVFIKRPDILRLLLGLEDGDKPDVPEKPRATARAQTIAAAALAAEGLAQDLNRTLDGTRMTPLMLALDEVDPVSVRLLLAAGADPTLLRNVGDGGGGGKGGKRGGKGGASGKQPQQNARLRSLAQSADSGGGKAGSTGSGTAESVLSRALAAAEQEGMQDLISPYLGPPLPYPYHAQAPHSRHPSLPPAQDVLREILSGWKPAFSGTALRADLGQTACIRVRAWLLKHAGETLWPAAKALSDLAAASGTGLAGPSWLSAPLLELLLQQCTSKGGADWRVGGPWTGPPGTHPLPRVAVWGLLSGAIVGTAPSPGFLATQLTPLLLKQLLERGVASPDERAPPGGTGQAQLLENSSLLHKVAFTGDAAIMQGLLAAGANIRAADASGNTPLHVASSRPHREEVAAQFITLLLGQAVTGPNGPAGARSVSKSDATGGSSSTKEAQQQAGSAASSEQAEAQDPEAEAEAALAAQVSRVEVLELRNRAGMWPEEVAVNKKVKKQLMQLKAAFNE